MRKFYFGLIILIIVIAILAISAAVWGSAKAEDEAYDVWIFCNPESVVNVREKPSSSSYLAGRMECGTKTRTDWETQKDNRGRTWLHIVDQLEMDESWVCMDYVSETEVTVEEMGCVVLANGRVAARANPDGKRKKWLNPGQEVKVLAFNDNWALTNKGYVNWDYLEEVE